MKKLIILFPILFLLSCFANKKLTTDEINFQTNGTVRESQQFTDYSQVVEVELCGKFLWIKSLDGEIIRVFKVMNPETDSNMNKVYNCAYGYTVVVSLIENFAVIKRDGKLEVAYGLPNKKWILKGT